MNYTHIHLHNTRQMVPGLHQSLNEKEKMGLARKFKRLGRTELAFIISIIVKEKRTYGYEFRELL